MPEPEDRYMTWEYLVKLLNIKCNNQKQCIRTTDKVTYHIVAFYLKVCYLHAWGSFECK